MKSRILYLISQLGPGGAERQLYYLLQTLDKERYKPGLVVWNFKRSDFYLSKIQEIGVPLFPLSRGLRHIQKLIELHRLIKFLEAEVVHSYSFYTNFGVWWASLGTQALSFGSVRSSAAAGLLYDGKLLGRLSARWPRVQISNSHRAAGDAKARAGIFSPRKFYVVSNGVDVKQFSFAPVPGTPVKIVGIGSLVSLKRWDLLLLAADQLKRCGFIFHLSIFGEGYLRDSLAQRIAALNLADCVELPGFVDDVPKLLAQSHFLVHTSEIEGCPNVVMEAMACGRAVVATDAGDVPFVVEDGKTGFVVRRGDLASLTESMATLMTNRDLCQRMGKAGRLKVEREFSLDRLSANTLGAYRAAGWKDDLATRRAPIPQLTLPTEDL